MAKKIINIGRTANDRSGDPLRTAFAKVNDNFTELYNTTAVDLQLPDQTNNAGKFLRTDGTNLSWVEIIGGNANTGDVTFNGVKIIGAGTASGDGFGYSTLELVPDGTLATDQYIIVDPTEPNHIHLRAGGTIDNSNTDLFLGGEANYVKVSDVNKRVTIKATSFSNDVSTWTFDPLLTGEGTVPAKIIFPDGTEQRTAWAGGRVVSAPQFSTGAAGDRTGDIAFSDGYFYYCKADFPTTYETTLYGGYSGNAFPSISKGDYPQPQAGWTFVWNTVTYTLIANATDPNAGQWQLQVDQTIDTQGGGTITLIPSISNIWKRVAWSGDTW